MKYIIRTESGTEIHIEEPFSVWREESGFGSENGPTEGKLRTVDYGRHVASFDDLGLTSLTQVTQLDTDGA